MENYFEQALEQVKNGEEEGLNQIYAQTYNLVYLRAKSIFEREEDVQQLMKEVYLSMVEKINKIRKDNLFSWLGKQTYMMGCKKYRKKTVREADVIELDEEAYAVQKGVDQETTCELIYDALETLPDMYQATFYAFYYDFMSIQDIAKVMDYSEGVIINRLNYMHKYFQKALAMYEEDTKAKVRFSLDAACETAKMWTKNNLMSEATAQSVYINICKELGLSFGTIEQDERETVGEDIRIVSRERYDIEPLVEEVEAYKTKPGLGAKHLIIGAVAVVVLAILVLAIVFIGGKDKKDKPKDNKPQVEQDVDHDEEEQQDVDTSEEDEEDVADSSEYILPNSATVRLTEADLAGLDAAQLRLARNELFARYGVTFGPEDLNTYFSSKSWYRPSISLEEFSETREMNDIEEANLALIVKVEDKLAR